MTIYDDAYVQQKEFRSAVEPQAPANRPLLSIVIVSYLHVDLVQSCLESIERYNDLRNDIEIVVVDNSPHHEVAHALASIRNFCTPSVTLIRNKNRGFGQGNNIGVKHTSGKVLLLLNPDTQLTEPLFQFAIDTFEEDEDLGAFGVQHRGTARERRMSFYWIDNSGIMAAIAIKIANRLGIFRSGVMFTSGAALFLRRDAFLAAGGFDEEFFLYNEERDLFRRIVDAGYTCSFFANRSLVHLEGSGSSPSKSSLEHRLTSLRHYCQKYNLEYRTFIRRELRVAKVGLLLRKLRRAEILDYEKTRVERLREELNVAADERRKRR